MFTDITHIFIDLDHTLWDFERNAKLTLSDLYQEKQLHNLTGIEFEAFFDAYSDINKSLWHLYNQNKITQSELRETRFIRTFAQLGVDVPADIHDFLAFEYVHQCTQKPHLLEGADDFLAHIQGRYVYHLITNGFNDSQWAKVKHSNLANYIQKHQITTSEDAGAHKPSGKIFEFVCQHYQVLPQYCVMIGDNVYADIVGGYNARMKTVFYNPAQAPVPHEATLSITHWNELKAYF